MGCSPRKVAEAVVLSGFDFETKERKRLSQNVGTKRQPLAATSGAMHPEKNRRSDKRSLHHSAVNVSALVAHRRPYESLGVSIQAFPANRRPNESLAVSIQAFPAHGSVQGRTQGPKFWMESDRTATAKLSFC